MANGIRVPARSFKYHRPRGIVGCGVEEPASLVEIAGIGGNHPITTVALTQGLEAKAVNCWPHPAFDIGAAVQLFARLIPAGFYDITFMRPDWYFFEPSIRRAARLANAPDTPPSTGRFEARHAHTDVLVIGAGPAGLAAAQSAGRDGRRVMPVDEAGGGILPHRFDIADAPASDWRTKTLSTLQQMPNVTHLQRATAWGYREHNLVTVAQEHPDTPGIIARSWRIRAAEVVQARGAIERALVFPGNDRAGIMLASAVQTHVNRYTVAPGRRVALFSNNDSACGFTRGPSACDCRNRQPCTCDECY